MNKLRKMTFGFEAYDPEEDDLIDFEAILLHWYEQLQDMDPEEARQEIESL
jgi:hypothetical protein